LQYDECRCFMKSLVEKYFNLTDVTISFQWYVISSYVEKHFNLPNYTLSNSILK
jgi:hypothetical protein